MIPPFTGNYPVSNPFGEYDPIAYANYPGKRHPGNDYPLPMRTPLYAAISGRVTVFDRPKGVKVGRGKEVSIAGGPYVKNECHLDEIVVQPGQYVNEGDLIGYSGNTGFSTGPHLHSELLINGVYVDQEKHFNKGEGMVFITDEALKDFQIHKKISLDAQPYKLALEASKAWPDIKKNGVLPVVDDLWQFKQDVLKQVDRSATAEAKLEEIRKIIGG